MTALEHRVEDLARLDSALRELWNEIERQDGERTLSRAVTMNFIGVADADGMPLLREAFTSVLHRHPCRAFLVEIRPDGAGLQARVAARAKAEGLGRRTVMEEITLQVDGHQFPRIPGLIRPLLVSDVPTHLFWARGLPDNAFALSTMGRLVDQVIVDSSLFEQPERDITRLMALRNLTTCDLTWFRLRPWRRALAEAFELVGHDPSRPTTVTIVSGPETGARAAAFKLGEWLRARLGAGVTLEPAPGADPALAPLWPCRVVLHHGAAEMVLTHVPPRLRLDVTLGDRCLLPYWTPVSRGSRGDLLAAAIDSI